MGHVHLGGVRSARAVAQGERDADTVDPLTEIATGFERHGRFPRASLA